MKKLLKPFKRHSREIDEKDVPRRSRSETRGRKSESHEQQQQQPGVESSHNTPVRPSTAAIAPAHPAIAVNGSGSFMNSNELIAQNNPIQAKTSKLGGEESLMTQPHRRRFSEDVADRNLPTGASDKLANGSVNKARGSSDLARKAVPSTTGRQQPAAVSATPITNRTVSTDAVAAARAATAPANRQAIDPITKRPLDRQPTEVATPSAGIAPTRYSTVQPEVPVAALPIREAPLSKKTPVIAKDRDAVAPTAANGQNGSLTGLQPEVPSALESSAVTRGAAPAVQPPHEEYAPLPKIPLTEPLFANATSRNAPFVPDETPITAPPVKRLPTDLRLPDGFSLQDSVDVDRSTTHAPAVTHEVIQPTVHHIRHEIITREIHTHDVYHRILPIVDVRILPARHYILDQHNDFKLKEVPECCIPGRTNDEHRSWTILETCSKFPELWSKDRKAPVERVGSRFTARTFAEKEGDTIEWVGKDGVARSERTWIHPPVSSSWGIEHGGTEPLYLDEFAPQPEIEYDYHINGTTLKDMTVFDPSTVHERSFEETPEIRNINGKEVIAERTPANNPISRPTVVSHNSNRAERLRLVDDDFEAHPSKIETVNAGMTGIAI